MKKTSKIFGAVALSATLALGTAVPAFATVDDEVGQDTAYSTSDTTWDKSASTQVNLRTTTDQIDCAVPISLVVLAKTEGGEVMCPSASAYTIKNNNTLSPLYVTNVKAALDDTQTSGEYNWTASNATSMPTSSIAVRDNAHNGSVYMQLTASGAEKYDTFVMTQAAQRSKTEDLTATGKKNWVVPKAVAGASQSDPVTQGKLNLDIDAYSSPISDISTDSTAPVALMTITYTVSSVEVTA